MSLPGPWGDYSGGFPLLMLTGDLVIITDETWDDDDSDYVMALDDRYRVRVRARRRSAYARSCLVWAVNMRGRSFSGPYVSLCELRYRGLPRRCG